MNYAEMSHIHGELVHFCIIHITNKQKAARKLCIKTYVQSCLCHLTFIQETIASRLQRWRVQLAAHRVHLHPAEYLVIKQSQPADA